MLDGGDDPGGRRVQAHDPAAAREEADGVAVQVHEVEASGDAPAGTVKTNERIRAAVEAAGVVFIDDDAEGGRGVRLGVRDRSRRR